MAETVEFGIMVNKTVFFFFWKKKQNKTKQNKTKQNKQTNKQTNKHTHKTWNSQFCISLNK